MKKSEMNVYRSGLARAAQGDVSQMANSVERTLRIRRSVSMPIHMADLGTDEQEFTLTLMESRYAQLIESALSGLRTVSTGNARNAAREFPRRG